MIYQSHFNVSKINLSILHQTALACVFPRLGLFFNLDIHDVNALGPDILSISSMVWGRGLLRVSGSNNARSPTPIDRMPKTMTGNQGATFAYEKGKDFIYDY